MKLVAYRDGALDTWGAIKGDGIVEGKNMFGGAVAGIRDLLDKGLLNKLTFEVGSKEATRKLAGLAFLPVVPAPAGIYCAGLNYHSHVSETGKEAPKDPRFFIRLNASMIGHEPTAAP